jgi:hypothetical protein
MDTMSLIRAIFAIFSGMFWGSKHRDDFMYQSAWLQEMDAWDEENEEESEEEAI